MSRVALLDNDDDDAAATTMERILLRVRHRMMNMIDLDDVHTQVLIVAAFWGARWGYRYRTLTRIGGCCDETTRSACFLDFLMHSNLPLLLVKTNQRLGTSILDVDSQDFVLAREPNPDSHMCTCASPFSMHCHNNESHFDSWNGMHSYSD
jgi:hypothetical protein